jgi:hypothetical protein
LFGFLLFMKNRKLKGIILALSFLLIFFCEISWSIDITVTGSWSENIDALNLLAGAGSNLTDTYQSATAAVQLNITAIGNWRVDVKKTDSNWHSSLELYVKRTGDGTGTGGIPSGGTSYQKVDTDIDQSFFTGNGDRSNIPVQLQLTGVSIQVPPGVYTTTVYYTVIQL